MRIVGASTSPPFTQATIAGWVFGVWNMNFLFHVIYGMSSETHWLSICFQDGYWLHHQPDWFHRRVRRFLMFFGRLNKWHILAARPTNDVASQWGAQAERRIVFLYRPWISWDGKTGGPRGWPFLVTKLSSLKNEDWWLPVARVALSGIKSLYLFIVSRFSSCFFSIRLFDSIKLVPN